MEREDRAWRRRAGGGGREIYGAIHVADPEDCHSGWWSAWDECMVARVQHHWASRAGRAGGLATPITPKTGSGLWGCP